MRTKQLIILMFIAILVPAVLWVFHSYSKPLPEVSEIDKFAGPPLEYSEERIAHKDEIINENYELAQGDQTLVDKLKQQPNPLYQSGNVIVRYDKDKDLFISEITTIRIEPAKREAVNWLMTQGVSLEAICTLPVTFTINDQSAQDLRGLGIQFDPLPSECK